MGSVSDFVQALRNRAAIGAVLAHHEVLPERAATPDEAPPPSGPAAAALLARRGIRRLYSHQARALAHVAAGDDVVLATPTATGKTLVYNLPAVERALADPEARALYLFPLKALEQDQRKRLADDTAALGVPHPPTVAVYDGDTKPAERRRIRGAPPNVLITTPDMLHFGILPHHGAWRAFFSGLRTVVIDELHTYRGIFGAHVAQVLRRLERVAAFHGARPQSIAASATIANPGELAAALTGREHHVIAADGAPRTERHVLLLDPDGSPYTLAARVFRLAVGMGLRTIAFTKARKVTELMHAWVVESAPELRDRVSSYRAGFLPSERREIERRLFSGDLLGVISTSALEMGIDVGSLDVCLLVGYPGSQMATWQRGGRVGRARDAAIALIAQPDALDQYLVAHPRVFLERAFEHAAVDPHNREVAAAHLPCAAAEAPLRAGEPFLQAPETRAAVADLEERGELLRSEAGGEWFAARRAPHRRVDLRAIGERFAIALDGPPDEKPVAVGTIGAGRVRAECHEGAIYLHRARQFLVTELDFEARTVRVRAVDSSFYTRALSSKETSVLSRDRERTAGAGRLVQGRLRVTTTVTGFERRRVRGQELLGTEPLDLEPTSFETVGVWLELPGALREAVEAGRGHPMGGIHALEHAALALFPLFTLCDRFDVGGISYRCHPETRQYSVFFYDGHPGGVGICASLYPRFESLMEATLEMIEGCGCEEGCPACVHSPKCGSGNRPIDKAAARRILRLVLGREPLPAAAGAAAEPAPEPAPPAGAAPVPAARCAVTDAGRRLVFFDLETQRSAAEVGGWHKAHQMRLAVAVVWDAVARRFESFFERDAPALIERLQRAELVVGFNVRRFDYAVLRAYTDSDLSALPTFDLLDAVHARLGFRLSLGHLAEETLGVPKSADGLIALDWWRQGRVEDVEAYCRSDVALVRDLFAHALAHHHWLFRTRGGERVRIPVRWSVPELIERAHVRPPRPTRRRRRAAARSPMA